MHVTKSKIILFDQEARTRMFEGITLLARAVSATMGSHGRTISIDKGRFNEPMFTKDGVTVAKEIGVKDPVQNHGIKIAYEAANNTNKQAGDSTTAAIVLIHALIEEGMKHVVAKRNVIQLAAGMQKACTAIVAGLKATAKKIDLWEEVEQIAEISSQNESIGKVVAKVIEEVGAEGSIVTDVKMGKPGFESEFLEGMRIDRGFEIIPGLPLESYLTNLSRLEYDMQDVYVLVTSDRITNGRQISPLFEALLQHHQKNGKGVINCIVISPGFDGNGLLFFAQNTAQGLIKPVLVRAPLSGPFRDEILEDIAIKTGGKFFSSQNGNGLPSKVEEAAITNFGQADRVVVGREQTAIIGGRGKTTDTSTRIELLRKYAEQEDDTFKKEQYMERISRLTSGIGVIRVSARTEAETEELRYRVEDALCAAKAALAEGTVAGGGVALIRALQHAINKDEMSDDVEDVYVGMEIVMEAVLKPAWQISTNAGEKGDVIVNDIVNEHGDMGFNLITRKIEDLRKAGIIDPTKAIRIALENAVGVASTFLTQGGCVVEMPEEENTKR